MEHCDIHNVKYNPELTDECPLCRYKEPIKNEKDSTRAFHLEGRRYTLKSITRTLKCKDGTIQNFINRYGEEEGLKRLFKKYASKLNK